MCNTDVLLVQSAFTFDGAALDLQHVSQHWQRGVHGCNSCMHANRLYMSRCDVKTNQIQHVSLQATTVRSSSGIGQHMFAGRVAQWHELLNMMPGYILLTFDSTMKC